MSLYVVVHPRFGDTACVAIDELHRPAHGQRNTAARSCF